VSKGRGLDAALEAASPQCIDEFGHQPGLLPGSAVLRPPIHLPLLRADARWGSLLVFR